MRKTAIKDVLTSRELVVLLITVTLAMDSFTEPRRVLEVAGRDGWLSIILAGGWSMAVAVTVIKLASLFPRQSPNAWIPQLFGRWGGTLFIVLYIIFFLLLTAWTLRVFSEVMKTYLLPRTPSEVIIFSLLLCVLYLTSYGLDPMTRVTGIFFLVSVVPGVIFIVFFPTERNLGELLPVMADGFLPVAKGFVPALATYHGWTTALYLLQFMDIPKEAPRAIVLVFAFLLLIFTWIYVLIVATFGPLEARYLLYPVLELVREMEGIRGFMEKMDLLFLIFWMIAIFISVAFTYYVPVLAASQLLGLQDRRLLLFCLLPLVYFLALLPSSYKAAESLGEWITFGGLALDFGMVALVLLAWLRRRRGGVNSHGE